MNISIQQLSYIAHLLYPQISGATLLLNDKNFQDLDNDYRTLLAKFGNNPIDLLNNVTKDCAQIIDYCQIGTFKNYTGVPCCSAIFSTVEYTLQYKCYRSGGKPDDYVMWEPLQALGLTVGTSMEKDPKNRSLDMKVAGYWAVIKTGFSAAVADRKSNLYYVSQTNMKLLEPNTYNDMPVERKLTDSLDKSSDFQSYEEGD